eukprot:GHVL01038797.1.p1 GENE.GHVL01038797.1~~GHVL01038797.1.p1  ORF type:complete len:190 (+),score=42.37 GHVL01038797.1:43-612(+)
MKDEKKWLLIHIGIFSFLSILSFIKIIKLFLKKTKKNSTKKYIFIFLFLANMSRAISFLFEYDYLWIYIETMTSFIYISLYTIIILYFLEIYYSLILLYYPLIRPIFILYNFFLYFIYILIILLYKKYTFIYSFDYVGGVYIVLAVFFFSVGMKLAAQLHCRSNKKTNYVSMIQFLSTVCPLIFLFRFI